MQLISMGITSFSLMLLSAVTVILSPLAWAEWGSLNSYMLILMLYYASTNSIVLIVLCFYRAYVYNYIESILRFA